MSEARRCRGVPASACVVERSTRWVSPRLVIRYTRHGAGTRVSLMSPTLFIFSPKYILITQASIACDASLAPIYSHTPLSLKQVVREHTSHATQALPTYSRTNSLDRTASACSERERKRQRPPTKRAVRNDVSFAKATIKRTHGHVYALLPAAAGMIP